MSTYESLPCAVLLAFAVGLGSAIATEGQRFGQPIAPEDAAAWDISIAPDGVGLPSGSGTPAQGAVVYAEKCAACHGQKGEGQPNDRLVGGQLTGDQPAVKTVGAIGPMPRPSSTIRGGRCRGSSRNRSPTMKSTR